MPKGSGSLTSSEFRKHFSSRSQQKDLCRHNASLQKFIPGSILLSVCLRTSSEVLPQHYLNPILYRSHKKAELQPPPGRQSRQVPAPAATGGDFPGVRAPLPPPAPRAGHLRPHRRPAARGDPGVSPRYGALGTRAAPPSGPEAAPPAVIEGPYC